MMPARLFLSSGDLMADRRFDFARDLQLKGDLVAAADLLLQATELAPRFASAWFTLGQIRERLGLREQAIAAFRNARQADPEDRHGASLRLMLLGAEQVSAMPQAYVRALFDQYASKFEAALVDHLGYRGPALLFKAVLAARHAAQMPAFFRRAIDLGCGTGLAAAAFASGADHFTGIDLSPRMIEQARARGIYHDLTVGELVASLRACAPARYDLALATDVLVYLGDLAPLFGAVARVLRPGGWFLFTVERRPDDDRGFALHDGHRYMHGRGYVVDQAAQAELAPVALEDTATRIDRGEPVPSLAVLLRRS